MEATKATTGASVRIAVGTGPNLRWCRGAGQRGAPARPWVTVGARTAGRRGRRRGERRRRVVGWIGPERSLAAPVLGFGHGGRPRHRAAASVSADGGGSRRPRRARRLAGG